MGPATDSMPRPMLRVSAQAASAPTRRVSPRVTVKPWMVAFTATPARRFAASAPRVLSATMSSAAARALAAWEAAFSL
jgi:hypothetical protein